MILRTVTGTIKKTNGSLWAGATLTFTPFAMQNSAGVTVPTEPVSVITNDNGLFTAELFTLAGSYLRYFVDLPSGEKYQFDLPSGVGSAILSDLFTLQAAAQIESGAVIILSLLARVAVLESGGDILPPTVPTAIVLTSLGLVSIRASWGASIDQSTAEEVFTASEIIVPAAQHNLAVTVNQFVLLKNTTNASQTITGIAGGTLGAVRQLVNRGTSSIILAGENVLSTAANRFTSSVIINPGGMVTIIHNGAKWEVYG